FETLAAFMSDPASSRALARAVKLLGLSFSAPPRSENIGATEETPSITAVPLDRRRELASRYIAAATPEINKDGSRQLIALAAAVTRGFALGPRHGFELLFVDFVLRHQLSSSEADVYARVRDAVDGPHDGEPLPWGCKLGEAAGVASPSASSVRLALLRTSDGAIAK